MANHSSYNQLQKDFLAERLALIEEVKAEGEIPRAVQFLNSGAGSFSGCLLALERHHANLAGYAWFGEHDVHELKKQCYIVSKLMYIRLITEHAAGFIGVSKIYYSLISDHVGSITWFSSVTPTSDRLLRLIENPAKPEYFEYQMSLAVRGDWNNLGRRAEMFLEDVPLKQKKYSVDMRFYLALANGDEQRMCDALDEIVAPNILRARKEDFWAYFPAQFVSPLATLYAKIAHRHGYRLNLDTPSIPNEWLPGEVLDDYVDPYPFMREYKIGQPLAE